MIVCRKEIYKSYAEEFKKLSATAAPAGKVPEHEVEKLKKIVRQNVGSRCDL